MKNDFIETFDNGELLVANGALVEQKHLCPDHKDQRGLQRDQRQRIACLDR